MRRACVLLVALLTLPSGSAQGCAPTASPSTLHEAGIYVLLRDEGVWIYQESNGLAGLQRHDDAQDDTCQGAVDGDALLF